MQTIYKYPVQPLMLLSLPADAKPLCVQMQAGEACMWVLLDNEAPTQARMFRCIGTGHDMDTPDEIKLEYIGTFQAGQFVYHLFEQICNGEQK